MMHRAAHDVMNGVAISFVIPTRNRRDVLARLLASIAAQNRNDLEVIVVDDGSQQPVTTQMLNVMAPARMRQQVHLISSKTVVGACAARNLGIAASRGSHVLFLDDDVELVGEDLCDQLLATMNANPDLGVIALAELAPDGSWGFNLGPPGEALEVARFHGCGALFRRSCIDSSGGFFEPLGYYYEEFELSMRVIDAGWRLMFEPKFQIIHHRDPRGRDPRGISRLISRNAILTAVARFPLWMMPAAVAAQMGRFAINTWLKPPLDRFGVFSVAMATAAKMPTVVPYRKTISISALRRYKRLSTTVLPWIKSSALSPCPSTQPNRGARGVNS